MKITDIEVVELRVPGWQGLTFDGSYDNCVIRLRTDEGATGTAEVDSVPSVIKAIIEAKPSHTHAMGLKTVLLGRDPSNVEALWDDDRHQRRNSDDYGHRQVKLAATSVRPLPG